MFSVPPYPGENLGKVCKNSRAGENPRIIYVFKRNGHFKKKMDFSMGERKALSPKPKTSRFI